MICVSSVKYLGKFLTLGPRQGGCGVVGWALVDGGAMSAAHRC